ncbi:MAG: GIY-YIG nuclease family protein [Crocinitomicaceae bacterium]|jgi:putative endonuclease
MMATLYILYSSRLKKYYTGSCENLELRLAKHKEKLYKNSFSSITDDWVLYFIVNDLEYKQARKIEMHIKKMKSKVYIENLNKYPEIIERLKEKYK